MRRLQRCADDRDILRREDCVEGRREFGVTIMNQEAHAHIAVLNLPTQLPRLLGHPRTRRVRGAASQMDTPTPEFNKEEHVQRLQPRGFDREEVTRQDLVLVMV